MVFYSGNSTLCKLFPESKIIKNTKVVWEYMLCSTRPEKISLGANNNLYKQILFNTMHYQYFLVLCSSGVPLLICEHSPLEIRVEFVYFVRFSEHYKIFLPINYVKS